MARESVIEEPSARKVYGLDSHESEIKFSAGGVEYALRTGDSTPVDGNFYVSIEGDQVILKVVKPGIRETLTRDAKLLDLFGLGLQLILPRYQPKRVLKEFTEYTLREVDLKREADNAETFAANFKDTADVRFPRIYRSYSASTVLCMEFFDGLRPDSEAAGRLTEEEKDRVIDLGVGAIIRMLYRDGFFHADLHPANLLILPGVRCGFIDLGMVGRFDDEVRRVLLYYYYCLVAGDAEYAARYLSSVAHPGSGADPTGCRRRVGPSYPRAGCQPARARRCITSTSCSCGSS